MAAKHLHRRISRAASITALSDSHGEYEDNTERPVLSRKHSVLQHITEQSSSEEDSVEVITGIDLKDDHFRVGIRYSYTMNCKSLGEGELELKCEPPNAAEIDTIAAEGKHYTCTITPSVSGDCEIAVLYGKKHVKGSPFHVVFDPCGDASKCRMIPTSQQCEAEATSEVILCISTEGAGQGKLTATAKSAGTKKKIPVSITQEAEDHYNIQFSPNHDSKCILLVKYDDQHIPSSPFLVELSDASKCHAEGEGLASAKLGEWNKFTVHTKDAGPGELNVVIQRKKEKGEDVEQVSISPKGENQFEVAYNPSKPGKYKIHIKWGEEHIPGSPFKISSHRAVEVIPPSLSNHGAYLVNHSYEFKVNTAGSAKGSLTTAAHGKHPASKLKIKTNSNGKDQYTISVKAKQPDEYQLSIQWDKEHVTGSPFLFTADEEPNPALVKCSDPQYTVGSSDPVTISVDTSNAGGGQLKAICHGNKAGAIPVEIKEEEKRKYTVSFVPPEPEVYSLSLLWGEENISNSPLKINLTPPDAEKCIASDPQIPEELHKPVEMRVDTTNAGNGTLEANAVGKTAGPADVMIKEIKSGEFLISFVPATLENYTLTLTMAGKPIPGSPFSLNLNPPKPHKVTIANAPTLSLEEGQPISIIFDTSKAGEGEMTASCEGRREGKIPVKVHQMADYQYVEFIPPKQDIYTLSVYWGGGEISRSPFKINLIPVDVTKIKTEGPHQPQGLEGPVELTLQAKNAGKGKATAACIATKAENIPVTITETSPDCYLLRFQPPEPDVYTFSVWYGGESIIDSPFHIVSHPPDASKVRVFEPEDVALSKPVTYKCDARYAGSGRLSATCTGNSSGANKIEIKEEEKFKGLYDVSFTPHKPDVYTISIQWSGEEVSGSPFSIDTTVYPEKVECGELTFTKVEKPVSLAVDTSKAGQAALTAKCTGELCGEVPVQIESTSDCTFLINFVPQNEDVYTLSVFYGNIEVNDSPFLVDFPVAEQAELHMVEQPDDIILIPEHLRHMVVPAKEQKDEHSSELPMYVGEPLVIAIEAEDESKYVTAAATGVETGRSDINISTNPNGTFSVYFNPDKPDCYTINVKLGGEHIQGSPFNVSYTPEEVECSELAFTKVEKPVSLAVDTSKAGQAALTVKCTGELCGEVPVQIESTSDCTFLVSFVPQNEDVYTLSVFYDNVEVNDSPFLVDLVPRVLVDEQAEVYVVEQSDDILLIPEHLRHMVTFAQEQRRDEHPSELTICVGEPLTIVIEAEAEEDNNKDVTAAAMGAKTGPSDVQVSKNPDGTFSIEFIPDKPDRYTVSVKLGEEHVPDSPFTINYIPASDPSKCYIFDLGSNPTALQVNQRLSFGVNAREARKGKLRVMVDGPSGETEAPKVEISSSEEDPSVYSIAYTPTATGLHRMHILWADKAIAGSPVLLHVGETNEIPLYKYGRPVVMDIYSSCETTDIQAHAVHKESGHEQRIKIKNFPQNKRFKLSFQPQQSGIYAIHVLRDGREIPGSPYYVQYAQPTVPEVCIVTFLDDKGYVGEPLHFIIDPTYAGSENLSVRALPPMAGKDSQLNVRQNENVTYSGEYVPSGLGKHNFEITWAGEAVPGSPFHVHVLEKPEETPESHESDASKVYILEEDKHVFTKTLPFNNPVSLHIFTANAGRGNLKIATAGPRKMNIKVADSGEGVHTCHLAPNLPGEYLTTILWNGTHIQGSPYVLQFSSEFPTITGINLESEIYYTEIPYKFRINCEDIGEEKLEMVCKPLSAAQIHLTPISGTSSVQCEIVPQEVGNHEISVQYNGRHILGSPFNVQFEHQNENPPDQADKIPTVTKPEKVRAYGPGLEDGIIGQEGNFTVETGEGGAGTLAVRVHGPKGAFKINMRHHPDNERTILVRYDPNHMGVYTIDITWSDTHIPGSPFKINIAEQCKRND